MLCLLAQLASRKQKAVIDNFSSQQFTTFDHLRKSVHAD
jgi:hypothetical protein